MLTATLVAADSHPVPTTVPVTVTSRCWKASTAAHVAATNRPKPTTALTTVTSRRWEMLISHTQPKTVHTTVISYTRNSLAAVPHSCQPTYSPLEGPRPKCRKTRFMARRCLVVNGYARSDAQCQ